eukprot:s8380_g4.t1
MALEAVRNVDRVGTICKLFNPPFVLHTLFLALWLQRADVKAKHHAYVLSELTNFTENNGCESTDLQQLLLQLY